jgi:hypothetical protein
MLNEADEKIGKRATRELRKMVDGAAVIGKRTGMRRVQRWTDAVCFESGAEAMRRERGRMLSEIRRGV